MNDDGNEIVYSQFISRIAIAMSRKTKLRGEIDPVLEADVLAILVGFG